MKYFTLVLSVFIYMLLRADSLFLLNVEKGDTVNLNNVIYNNSLLIMTDSDVLKNYDDYLFFNGIIQFNKQFDSISIMYTYIPVKLNYINYTHSADSLDEETRQTEGISRDGDVFMAGIKGFNLSVNNNGAFSFNQSLEMNMEGKIDDRWTLRGSIYDDGSPGSPGVYNVPVSQIEDISITLYDSLSRIILGNSQFEGYNGRFTMINRQVLGIYGRTELNGYEIKASVAGQKGKYTEKTFYCSENIQGPYALTEEVLLIEYIITPESDRIYGNGILLKRGEDADYTINYQTGEIYFTDNFIVDESTLIYAQFQTYEQSSSMTGYYGGFSTPDSIVNILFIREEQNIADKNEQAFFAAIGSDSSAVFLSTVEYVGEGNGNYLMNDSILVFAGNGAGDYTASFYYVGMGNGDYLYSPAVKGYVFAGKDNGNYMPGRYVDLPYESNYLSADLYYPIGKLYMDLSTGGGFYKANRYSLTGRYESDIAYSGEIGFKEIQWGYITADMYYRRMYFPNLYRSVWNNASIEDIAFNAQNALLPAYSNADVYYAAMNAGNYNASLSIAMLDSLLTRHAAINMNNIAGMHLTVQRRINTMADTLIYEYNDIAIKRAMGSWEPGYNYQYEINNKTEYKRHIAQLLFSGRFSIRYTNECADGMINRKSDMFSIRSSFNAGSFSLLSNVNFKHITPDSGRITNTLIMRSSINGYIKPWWNAGAEINISSVSEYEMNETFIYAGRGRGDYVYDSLSGNYLYDEYEGDYIRIIENVLSDNAVSSRKISLHTAVLRDMLNINAELNYADRSPEVLTFGNGIIGHDVYSFIYGDWKISTKNSIFSELHYANNNMYSTGFYRNYYIYGGYRRTDMKRQLTLSSRADYQNSTNDYSSNNIRDISILGDLRIDREKHLYSAQLTLSTADAVYYDILTDSMDINIRKTQLSLSYKYRFTREFSMQIRPSGTFNIYDKADSSEIPLTIYYKYPDGASMNISSIISYNNSIFSVSGIYTAQYTQKLGFRQKAEVSLYTYF